MVTLSLLKFPGSMGNILSRVNLRNVRLVGLWRSWSVLRTAVGYRRRSVNDPFLELLDLVPMRDDRC